MISDKQICRVIACLSLCVLQYPPLFSAAPPIQVPYALNDAFTLHGQIPIGLFYIDETYSDEAPIIYTFEQIENGRKLAQDRNQFCYGITDLFLYDALDRFPIQGKKVAIMGSRIPTYECITLAAGGHPTTIEYNKLVSLHSEVRVMRVNEYAANPTLFDVVISISSFEHDGLGRYGDPIDPNGDLRAMAETKKMLKKGGLLFLSVPIGRDYLVWNAHRIYGKLRFPLLIEGWDIVGVFGFNEKDFEQDPSQIHQPVFVLTPNYP